MKTLTYKVSIDSSIKRNLINFKKEIHKILTHPLSWKVNFIQNDYNYDFEIILTPAIQIHNKCNFKGLSCADNNTKIIYINNYRWLKGSVRSKLSLKDYRTYIINHEVGHILGFGHIKPIKNSKVPVMNQSTLGLGGGLPNMYPILKEHQMLSKLLNQTNN